MNQVDKELLISKRFMNEEEQINVKQIELEAMMEATIFAGAIMENSMDVDILLAISQKIMHLDCNNQQLQIHLLVQRLFKDSRACGELDSFYVASLHGETLKTYSTYFSLFLAKLVNEMSKAKKSIGTNRGLEVPVSKIRWLILDMPQNYGIGDFVTEMEAEKE